MNPRRRNAFFTTIALTALGLTGTAESDDRAPGRFAGGNTVIGFEYAVLNNERLVKSMATTFAEIGLPGMKHYVEVVDWGAMQKGPDAPIDFSKLDLFVREYQNQGFTELTVSLKSHSPWASKNDIRIFGKSSPEGNPTPKPEYRGHYQNWVRSVVERYDADGRDDMPGLRWPVRYVEIGNEFSSYEPEPVEEYLEMLALAYEAAHEAYDDVRVAHVAFLTTPVNMDVENPEDYDAVWRTTKRKDTHHDLADIRAILDRPDLFDVINLHNLGDPYEIEDQMRWLAYETGLRGYAKPVIISDTVATSYVGWGPATDCKARKRSLLGRPATEADRCRLADYFTKLIDKDPATLAWTRGFVAADHVQRSIIAAEQGVLLINLAFVADIGFLTTKPAKAGAGISAWGGAIRINPWTGKVQEKFPLYYAVKQLMTHISGYDAIERLSHPDERARIYRVRRGGETFWVAWRDPQAALLPKDGAPSLEVRLDVGAGAVWIEPVIAEMGQTAPQRVRRATRDGRASVTLKHQPIFVFSAD